MLEPNIGAQECNGKFELAMNSDIQKATAKTPEHQCTVKSLSIQKLETRPLPP